MNDRQKIKKFLSTIGFSALEINIYLKIFEHGVTNIADLCKRLNIPRTTVVRSLEKLTEKGMISKTVRSSKTLLIAEVPKKLELLLREKLLSLEDEISQVKDGLNTLHEVTEIISSGKRAQEADDNITFKYYEGIQGVKNIYRLIIESGAKQIYTFLNADKYFDLFPETHDLFKKFLIENPDSYIYEIIVGDIFSTKLNNAINDIGDRCICKLGVSTIQFKDFDFLIYDNNVVMIQINENSPVAILIQSSAITSGLKGMHQMLWASLPHMN